MKKKINSQASVLRVKISLGALCCAMAMTVAAAKPIANRWKAVDGSYDGEYTDAAHWSLGEAPDIQHQAGFDVNASYKVTFPAGVFTNNAALRPAVYGGQTVEIDGSDTVLVRADDPTDSYPDETFGLLHKGMSWHFFNLERYAAFPEPDRHAKPDYLISNFYYRMSSPLTDSVKGEFLKGSYNFYDPPGSAWTTAPYMIFFGGRDYKFDYAELVFGPGTSFRFPSVRMNSNALTNWVVFAGKAEFYGSVAMPSTQNPIRENDAETHFLFKDGADVAFNAGISAGSGTRGSGVGEDRRWNFLVESGAKFTLAHYFSHWCGHFSFDVAGEWAITDRGYVDFCLTNQAPTVSVVIRDGGILRNEPKSGSKRFHMGKYEYSDAPSTFAVTNATVYNGAEMLLGTSTFTNALVVNEATFGVGYGKEPMLATFKDSVITNRNIFLAGRKGGSAILDFDNTYFRSEGGQMCLGGIDEYNENVSTATVNVVSGRFDLAGSASITVGYPGMAYGIFNFKGGELTSTHYAPFHVGLYGNGEFNLSGGTVSLNHLRTGASCNNRSDGSIEDVVRVTGGTLVITSRQKGYGISISENVNRSGRLILDGGVVKCHQFWGNVGKSAFEANGGTIVAVESNTYQMYDFDEARLGEKGLTFDSEDYDVTIAQSFSDKADAEGSGRLILKGGGTKTLTGDLSGLSYVEVCGGTVDITGRTVRNLVLNGGTLKVDPSSPITVTEGCEFGNVLLALNGGDEIGDVRSIIKLAKPLSEEQLAAWQNAVAVSGLAADTALTMSQVEDGNGGYVLRYEVREAGITEINLDSGRETRSTSYANGASDIFSVNVAKDADLTLSGTLQRGTLVKKGDGALTLTNADNLFVLGWDLRGGKIRVTLVDALGGEKDGCVRSGILRDGTLEFAGESEKTIGELLEIAATTPTNGVIVKVSGGDVTMPAPKVTAGSFIKRGPGRLVWEIEGARKLMTGEGYTSRSPAAWPYVKGQKVFPMVFDEQNGIVPTNASYGCFNVVDGEMVLRGKGEGASASINGVATLGHPTQNGTVQPGLVVDGCSVDFYMGGCHFVVAPEGKTNNTFVTSPYIVVTNGGFMKVDTLMVGKFNDRADLVSKVKVTDGSTLYSTYILHPNESDNITDSPFEYEITGGSRLLCGSEGINLRRQAVMTFDNSILAKNVSLEPLKIWQQALLSTARLDARFVNGSEFRCYEIRTNRTLTAENPMRFTFDNSKWIPTLSGDFTFECELPETIVIAVTNVGLVLDVPADATWTMNRPVTGTGGIVKQGSGTLVLGATSVAYGGVTRIDDGVVDLGGNSLPVKVGGSGTLTNGTIADGGIAVSVAEDGTVTSEIPTLAGVEISGRLKVDCGRSAADGALERPYRTVAVAKYDGEAPNISRWKAVNLGQSELRGKFEAVDGVVYMTPVFRSMVISIR